MVVLCAQTIKMLYKTCVAVAFLAGADAFQVGSLASRVNAPKVSMAMAEAVVASPVALAKVQALALCRRAPRAAVRRGAASCQLSERRRS